MQRPPLDRTARKLIAAMLLRAVRDLGYPDWRCEALTWLAGEGAGVWGDDWDRRRRNKDSQRDERTRDMTAEKTFDKADLLRFFHEAQNDALVGRFTVIHPPTPQQLAFDDTAETGETVRYPVAAETTALHCERYGFAVVLQSVVFPDGGDQYLPKDATLRTLVRSERVITRNGGSSAQLVRWATELADEWRTQVAYWIPATPIDRRRPSQRTDDNTPTGETVDDVLAQHDGDGGDESEGAE